MKALAIRSFALTAALCAPLAACAAPEQPAQVRGSLTAIGTAAQGAPIAAWRSAWMKEFPETSLNYSPDGSQVGINALVAGQAYFAATDAPLSAQDFDASHNVCGPDGAFSVPVAVIPVGVLFNLPSVKNLKLNAHVLSEIFSGRIKSWDDPEIARLNPEADLPDKDIVPVHAKEESTLTNVVTDFLATGNWEEPPSRVWPQSVAGIEVRKYSDIAKKVDDTAGSMAFVDRSAIGSTFDTALLDFGKGFVRMNDDTLSRAIAAGAVGTGPGDSVTFTPDGSGADAYGLSAVTYQSYCSTYPNDALARLVKSWGSYVLSGGGQSNSARFAGVTTLNEKALRMADSRIDSIGPTE